MIKLHEVSKVSRQALHKHNLTKSKKQIAKEDVLKQVDKYRTQHPGCGVRKTYYQVKPKGIGRDQFIQMLMNRGYGVKKVKNYTRTTIAGNFKYPNLIEGSQIDDINQIWQSDITYFYVNGDFYYITYIIDVYSRLIVGYDVSDSLKATSCLNALKMALKNRKGMDLSKLIHHSDRGVQYISNIYTELLKNKGIKISMGLKAQDNAYAERINGIMKNEFLRYKNIDSLKTLKVENKRAVNFYNKYRHHNSLGHISPADFEKKLTKLTEIEKPKMLIYSEKFEDFKTLKEKINTFEKCNYGTCPLEIRA